MPKLPIPTQLRAAAVAGGRWAVWMRLLILAEVALAVKRHLDRLDADEKSELRRLVTKSKGRPSNLNVVERATLRSLVEKIEPGELAREAARSVVPTRFPGG